MIYGLWEGYDDQNNGDTRRNILPLPEKAGQEFRLLYPIRDAYSQGGSSYLPGKTMTMLRSLNLEEETVPAGTYYLQYCVTDALLNTTLLDPIEMSWDGSKWVFPEGFTWEGKIDITADRESAEQAFGH